MNTSPEAPVSAKRTLWRHLWGWAVGALALVWLSLIGAAWTTGHHEAREITDGQLIATGRLWLATAPVGHRPVERALNRQGMRTYVQDVVVLQWDEGRLSIDTHGLASRLPFTQPPAPGLTTIRLKPDAEGQDTGAWRMFVITDQVHQVAVLLDLAQRYDLASDLAFKLVGPALLIMPLIALVLWWAIRRGLRPLHRLSHEVASLDVRAGQRLAPHDRFAEFASTVSAINSLVDSLQAQIARERQFASDVAHELRTPLTSLALQASAARHTPTPERLTHLENEALRGGHILTLLLDLARAQRGGGTDAPTECVALGEVATQVVAAHAQLAYERGHDLSLQQPEKPVVVRAHRLLLEMALRNLVDNALRHTPAGTQVCVEVWRDGHAVGLGVRDSGPLSADAAPTGNRLPGNDGLGLGLRLVERMAEQMGAQLHRETNGIAAGKRFVLQWAQEAVVPLP